MAERDLQTLLKGLKVHLHGGVWRFVSMPAPLPDAIMGFKEREGWTSITEALATTPAEQQFVWLELTVYSDLNAVGFLAAVSAALAAAKIPCNAVAAYHHDHIFVPAEKAEEAIGVIEALSRP